MKLSAPKTSDGGSSPVVKPKEEKQVEYLDLDLDPGKSTPPRKVGIVLHSLTQVRVCVRECVHVLGLRVCITLKTIFQDIFLGQCC